MSEGIVEPIIVNQFLSLIRHSMAEENMIVYLNVAKAFGIKFLHEKTDSLHVF